MPYYTHPVQVRYLLTYQICYGIAYHDYIINGATGAIDKIEQICESCDPDDVITELSWVDLTKHTIS